MVGAWTARLIYVVFASAGAYVVFDFLRYPEMYPVGFEGPFADYWVYGSNTRFLIGAVIAAAIALAFFAASFVAARWIHIALFSGFVILRIFSWVPEEGIGRIVYAMTGELDLSQFARCPGLRPTVRSAIFGERQCQI